MGNTTAARPNPTADVCERPRRVRRTVAHLASLEDELEFESELSQPLDSSCESCEPLSHPSSASDPSPEPEPSQPSSPLESVDEESVDDPSQPSSASAVSSGSLGDPLQPSELAESPVSERPQESPEP